MRCNRQPLRQHQPAPCCAQWHQLLSFLAGHPIPLQGTQGTAGAKLGREKQLAQRNETKSRAEVSRFVQTSGLEGIQAKSIGEGEAPAAKLPWLSCCLLPRGDTGRCRCGCVAEVVQQQAMHCSWCCCCCCACGAGVASPDEGAHHGAHATVAAAALRLGPRKHVPEAQRLVAGAWGKPWRRRRGTVGSEQQGPASKHTRRQACSTGSSRAAFSGTSTAACTPQREGPTCHNGLAIG